MRDHDPITIEDFNGWWNRDDEDSAPLDHFNVADNIRFFASGVETRYALDKYQSGVTPLDKVLRVYNYVTQTGQTLLVLTEGGKIYHVTSPTVAPTLILTIPLMTDFGFVAIAGRAYITPFTSYTDANGQSYELGLPNEKLRVYKGDQSAARVAGGVPPTNAGAKALIAYNNNVGTVTKGFHIIGVSISGTYAGPKDAGGNWFAYPTVDAPGDQKIQITGIPLGPAGTIKRTIAMTHALPAEAYPFSSADLFGQSIYVALVINDNTTESVIIDVTDAQLTTNGALPITTQNFPITTSLAVINTDTAGFKDEGFHLVAVVYETDTGYLTAPGPSSFAGNTYVGTTKRVIVFNIPVPTDPSIVKKHIVSTKAIPEYNGDQNGYQFFFIPGAVLDVGVTAKDLSYFDSDLISDASHLIDNYTTIPAGVALTTYHSRLVLVGDPTIPDSTTFLRSKNPLVAAPKPDNRSIAWVSAPGEPESISKIDGLIVTPLDGNPLTNCMEFRDRLHLFKSTRTYLYMDNQDEPATWQEKVVDQAVGAPVHGVATVLDSGGVNVDFLLVGDWSGLMLFNGTYARPELTWKIENYWMRLDRNGFKNLQIMNDSIGKKIYITLPTASNHFILFADYGNGLDAKSIKWARWQFDGDITSVSLIDTNKVILGADVNFGGVYYVNRVKTLRHDSYNNAVEKKIPDPTIRTVMLGG